VLLCEVFGCELLLHENSLSIFVGCILPETKLHSLNIWLHRIWAKQHWQLWIFWLKNCI